MRRTPRPQSADLVLKREFAVVESRDNGECLFRSLLSATFAGGQPRNPPESVLAAGVASLKRDIHKRICASNRLRQVLRDTQDLEPTGETGPVGRADHVSASSYCSARSPLFETGFFGGELELMVAADVLGVTVAVVKEASQTAYAVARVYGKGPALVWVRLGGIHYDWLYPKKDIARSFRPSPGSALAAAEGTRRRTPKAVTMLRRMFPRIFPRTTQRSQSQSRSRSRARSPPTPPPLPRPRTPSPAASPLQKLRRKYARATFGSPTLAANTALMNNAQRQLAMQFKGTTVEAKALLANLGHAELAKGRSPATIKGLAAMAMEAL